MMKCLNIQEVLKNCVVFLLPLVFSYSSSLTSTSFVVPKTAPWVFYRRNPSLRTSRSGGGVGHLRGLRH